MMKFTQLMTYGVGGKTVTFTGREPFRIEDDAAFEAALLATGCFEKLEDGTMRYSAKVSIVDKDGVERPVQPDGYVSITKDDLEDPTRKDLI